MTPMPCATTDELGQPIGSRIPAQTLFLGATVLSYSANMGWGGQASTVTVELINDFQPESCIMPDGTPIPVFKPGNYPDNHYYNCVGDDCYVDENGNPYNSNREPPPLQKKIPGKVYYAWTPNGLVSRYWFYEDPGFFGESTRIGLDGNYLRDQYTSYDIIGVPVYFVMDGFIFGGVIQSWEKSNRQGQVTYTVTIESMDNILDNSWIILRDYGGSVFTKILGSSGSVFGAPINYVGTDQAVTSIGSITEGALPNVFNVYGFLESFNINNFGGASSTEEGLSCVEVINALSVLTSCLPRGNDEAGQLNDLNKRAFSPFGRILTKTIQENGSLLRPSGNIGFGVISHTLDTNSIHRTSFTLDLSELPAMPRDIKVNGDVITIMEFIRSVTSQMGRDFYTSLIPYLNNGIPSNVIKLKVIDRNTQPAQNQISETLTALQSQGYSLSIDSLGKEWSQSATPRVMYVGGKQERIYQAKNYRLAYKQTAYIYDPFSDQIVNFHTPLAGKIKVPVAFSTRNTFISIAVNGADNTALWDSTEEIHRRMHNSNFDTNDSDWADSEVGGSDQARTGNYNRAKLMRSGFATGSDATGATDRYIPIYMDVICPFFGYASETKINISTDGGSNNFRKIRPVWLDSWTGQLVVVCDIDELPLLTMGTSSLYRTSELRAFTSANKFFITETEMRAAMAGFDSYFSYCYAKSVGTKPHLFLMLMTAYYYANPKLAHGYGWLRTGVASGVPFMPPGFSRQAQNGNAAGIQWEYVIDPMFIRDLMILTEFVANLGRQYYGQKYMVRIPELSSYRDRTYADIDIPGSTFTDDSGDTIAVFSGTGRIYFNVEPCDSGWEEPGNVIDDSFVIGSEAWYALMNDQGKLPPLLGYNASSNYDYEARMWCGMETIVKSQAWNDNDSNYNRWFLSAQGVCDDSKFIYPSLNLGSLSKNDFVIVNTATPRRDAFGRSISAGQPPRDFRPPVLTPDGLVPFPNPEGMSKKLFLKAQQEGVAFMDPINLAQPRVIISSQGVTLNPASISLDIDPTRTVFCNAALEDLIVYLKMTIGTTIPYDASYVHNLLNLIRGYEAVWEIPPRSDAGGAVWNVFGYAKLDASKQYAMLAEKCAHPHFAAIPLRYNQFTYGPWTNYPYFVRNELFLPGIEKEFNSLVYQRDYLQALLNQLNQSNPGDRQEAQTLRRQIQILNQKIARYQQALQNFDSGYAIENVIGNTKIEINQDHVPWNYGGMAFLDRAIISYINSNIDYQTILETSQVSIASSPLFGLGGEFKPIQPIRNGLMASNIIRYGNDIYLATTHDLQYKDVKLDQSNAAILDNIPIIGSPVYLPQASSTRVTTNVTYNLLRLDQTNRSKVAPIISNLSVRFDSGGFNTTYSFRSYAKKLGLYAKEQSDRLKKAADNNLRVRKEIIGLKAATIAGNAAQIQNRLVDRGQHVQEWSVENSVGGRNGTFASKLFGTSPTEVLIGAAKGYVPLKGPIQAKLAMDMAGYDPQTGWKVPVVPDVKLTGKDPGDLPVDYNIPWHTNKPGQASLISKIRHSSWVGMYQHWETMSELDEGYNQKAAMSLDGIFSPVSFYPTLGNTTYAMLPYNSNMCPHCGGTQTIRMRVATGHNRSSGFGVRQAVYTEKSYVCPACTRGVPEYVASSGTSGVNSINLQPIVVPYLEWSNYHAQPANSGERKRHSIGIVGRNQSPPYKASSGGLALNIQLNKETFIDPDTGQITVNGNGINPDFAKGDIGAFFNSGKFYPNNQRFFALRGPLMMHGWGYDTSGHPVPNAADEPLAYDDEGRPKRFFLTASGTNDYSLDGDFVPQQNKRLGDIIGKGWVKENGKWTRKPSKYFYLNWAERPDLWPVGPIDLRWDYERRVWVGGGSGGGGCSGNDLPPYIIASNNNDVELLSKFSRVSKGKCSYKMIYVVLEENLIKEPNYDQTYPTRAFIDDIQYSTEAMPNNARKLVFVKDKAGYTAPRGAKLLCRYDSDTGFYEPISKQTFFVFGTISNGNGAIIDLSYIQGQHRGSNVPTMQITFDNSRFNFNTSNGSTGMFYFENGKWILISCKESSLYKN